MITKYTKIAFSGFLALNLFFANPAISQEKKAKQAIPDYTKYVNPLIGSAGHGHVFVGANVPFGAVQLGPVNIFEGWDWCSGYNYVSNTILGFTHTHLSGTGIGDLNDILILPVSGKVPLFKGTKEDMTNGYGSYFSHENEVSKPGYYSVLLDKYKIKAELTASERVGFHKYTFNSANDNHVLVDLADGIGWDKPIKTFIKKINETTLAGYRFSAGWATDQRVYFTMEFSEPISNLALYDDKAAVNGNEGEGLKMKAVLDFTTLKNKQVLVKVGISPVSAENAAANIKAEIPNWDFDQTVKTASSKWNAELNKIQITGNDKTMKVFLYFIISHHVCAFHF